MPTTDKLEFTFADGSRLECVGTMTNVRAGDLMAKPEGGFVERCYSAQFVITEGTLTHESDDAQDLEPGTYLVNDQGLWRHV